ncbi:MAG: hypothetical protein AAFQ64_12730 [Pseudomonadota bacterium]
MQPKLRTPLKALCAIWSAAFFLCQPTFSTAQQLAPIEPLVVTNDRGGLLRKRIAEIQDIVAASQPVQITGRICYSTCTMYLGLPDTCVAPDTVFGFHGPSSYGRPLAPDVFEQASQTIAAYYPEVLRDWYMTTARHELRQLHKVRGSELIRLGVRQC